MSLNNKSKTPLQIIYFKKWQSTIGPLFLYATQTHLIGLLFKGDSTDFMKYYKNAQLIDKSNLIIKDSISQLKEYFAGKRKQFDLPILLSGTTFQKSVWSELSQVPFGKTITYKEQAKRIKSEKAVRAVGAANGKNPVAIVIPCHRVIGSNGKLVGYAGGDKMKSDLLKIEGLLIKS